MGLTQTRQKIKRHGMSLKVYSGEHDNLERLMLIEMCVCVSMGNTNGHSDRCFLRWIKCHQVSFCSSLSLTCPIIQTCNYFDPKNV